MASEHISILLIDDDPYIHDAVRMILEPLGYHVTCCSTGPTGLATMRRDRPQLVLLDIMLATPSEGFHLAYEMKRDEVLKNIPIIVLSAVGRSMGMDFACEIGTEYLPVDRFLEKPFDAAALREAVDRVLHREGALP
jgi:DNA-binding response OmpR family regulator